jgi:mono/diheme cytochrome c family protein
MFPKTAVIISQTTGRSPHAQAMWAWKLLYTVPSLLQLTLVIGLAGTVSTALAVEPSRDELQRQFAASVRPFLQTYCQSCHSPEKSEAELDLSGFSTLADVARRHPIWEIVLERLEAREMPPAEAKPQPTMDQRRAVVEWIRAFRRHEAQRHAGDPGPVLARRLSNAEYNYTIRDLTGVDIRPAQEFPIDPANAAGFDNSGESLAMSPALLQKYLDAARRVTEHLVLTPEGFAFAPHPAVTETDRDKYCVKRIVAFYQHQPTDYADYFLAAWRYRHRESLGQPTATLADIATADHVSAKYLARVWSALTESAEAVGPMANLQSQWRALPSPDGQSTAAARHGCEQLRDFVVPLRKRLEFEFPNLKAAGIHNGSQTFVLWKNRQYATHRRRFNRDALKVQTADTPDPPDENERDRQLMVPADPLERARYEASFAKFCEMFPDAFYIAERGRDYLGKSKDEQEKGRLLSAGFHSMMGYFRDDGPLYDLILDERQQAELDALWRELDFITSAPMRQYSGFLWFERTDSRYLRDAEFDFARAEDKDATTADKLDRLAKLYLAKAVNGGAKGVEVEAIEEYFRNIDAQIRWVEQARLAAEPRHLQSLAAFAERAYRRPLLDAERDDLLAFYRHLRTDEQLSHEEAVQDALISVLMSPHFCYRMDLAAAEGGPRPLTDYELASRLSYFLWSSQPDAELLRLADAGTLHRPEVLTAQTQRMLQDDRVRGLAVEFGANWLDVRRFESHNSVDRERFPTFTNELRQAMFEEPIRFFLDVAQQDRSVLEFLDGSHTFVNPVLARHYGIPVDDLAADQWVRIDRAADHQRGGLLPMAVFLTQNSPGLRTSPVKRGYWVVRRLLGERIPPPPPTVPELPADEAKLGDLTLREVLAKHRDHKSCAGCHERFDSLGLAFEGFGPIGEARKQDLGGRPVDVRATFPGGTTGSGLDGLRGYLREHRRQDFLDNLCRKLLSYALGRTLLPSDDELIATMQRQLAANGERFGVLVERIVASPQFLNKRGQQEPVQESDP